MSRPVYEPSLPRTDAQLGYGNRQLFRRPSPLGAGEGLSLAWIFHGNGSSDVPTDTLFNVINDDFPNNPWEEGFISDPDTATFQVDLEQGIISWNVDGQYLVYAELQLNSTPDVGSAIVPVIDMGNSGIFANERIGAGHDASAIFFAGANKVTVVGMLPALRFDSVRFLVYHNSAADASVESMWLHVVQLRVGLEGTFYPITS